MVTPDMRSKAKMDQLWHLLWNVAFGLAQRVRIPRKEAAAIIERTSPSSRHKEIHDAAQSAVPDSEAWF